jgi:hypothetical protein
MTTIDLNPATVERPGDRFERDEAELAAASFLARYSGPGVKSACAASGGGTGWIAPATGGLDMTTRSVQAPAAATRPMR